MRIRRAGLLAAAAVLFLVAGFVLRALGAAGAGRVWTAGLVLVGVPLVGRTVAGLFRGRFAADVVAAMAIAAALILGEPIAGLVIALMQSGGEALEDFAARRAGAALAALEADSPRVAHRVEADGTRDVAAGSIEAGQVIVVRPGEMVPCDGIVTAGEAGVDLARVTGEPVPLHARPGVVIRSGSLVVDGPLTMHVTAPARESLYVGVVELVREAQASKAPFQRMADRAAVWFTPLTLLVCGAAWLFSHDSHRVLAVLVVATPCPLILAAPVAFVGGINRAAARGIVVRHGGALEALATADVAVLDKTGTLTLGTPRVVAISPAPDLDETTLLARIASVEADVGHPMARAIVEAAAARGVPLAPATQVREFPGRGATGRVGTDAVVVGSRSLVQEFLAGDQPERDGRRDDLQYADAAINGRFAGQIAFTDPPRPGVVESLAALRRLGFHRMILLSGDHAETAHQVGRALGFSEVAGDLLPADKTAWVQRLRAEGSRVLMVGDGINDAPALMSATVGVAMAQHGGGIAAESADVVLLHEHPGRLVEAVEIARRTLRVARQSVWTGLGLSGAAMAVAAWGYLTPVAGALLQEVIDLVVILNALRAARGAAGTGRIS